MLKPIRCDRNYKPWIVRVRGLDVGESVKEILLPRVTEPMPVHHLVVGGGHYQGFPGKADNGVVGVHTDDSTRRLFLLLMGLCITLVAKATNIDKHLLTGPVCLLIVMPRRTVPTRHQFGQDFTVKKTLFHEIVDNGAGHGAAVGTWEGWREQPLQARLVGIFARPFNRAAIIATAILFDRRARGPVQQRQEVLQTVAFAGINM